MRLRRSVLPRRRLPAGSVCPSCRAGGGGGWGAGGRRWRPGPEVLELAGALKRENPDRTAAQVVRILRAHSGWAPSERTVLRHFERLELRSRPGGAPPTVFGRFEAASPHDRWVGDALHGP